MSITAQQVQSVDFILSHLGIPFQEYLAAKQATLPSQEPEGETTSPYLSRREAADLLKVSTDTVDNLIAAGKIRSSKLSPARCGRVLVDRKSLLAFVRRSATSCKQEVDNGRR